MAVLISAVEAGSPARKQGVQPGESLVSINGNDIHDVLDYRFYMTEKRLGLELLNGEGRPYTCTVTKDEYQDLGLEFDTYLMDKQRFCKNKCIFCFIDQMPVGLRESLYFKDDDSRMSFLFGNYVTLTNLEEWDIRRIIDMRISPINVSVHTTNPRLRVEMMKNPSAGKALDALPRLTKAGIKVNAQLVLCPGINDGEELERSLRDLTALSPNLQSVAVVPVGLTRHREGLQELRLFTPDESTAVIDTVDRYGSAMLEEHGQRICFAADEFYLNAGRPIPGASFYEDFAQLENGVGLLALLCDEFRQALDDQDAKAVNRTVTIATGQAARSAVQSLADAAMERFPGLEAAVVPIDNDFFGRTITVAGLVTGGDLVRQLSGRKLGDALLIPSVMLRHEGDLFLDDVSLAQVEAALHAPVCPVPNDGYALLDALLGNEYS